MLRDPEMDHETVNNEPNIRHDNSKMEKLIRET